MDAGQVEKPASDRAAEIEAKCWFNAQPVRLNAPPKLILLEFWSARSRESRAFVDLLSGIHRAYDDGRLLIVALTEDACDDTETVSRREKIPYKIGGESRSSRDYKIEDLPGVVLIDAKDNRVVARWSGKEVSREAIAKAIQEVLGSPPGGVPPGALSPSEHELLMARLEEASGQIASITSEILAIDGEIGPETALSALDRFYEQNLPENPSKDDAMTRVQDNARAAIMEDKDVGYGKLISSGRLSEAARNAIRDRVLEIAEKDPAVTVRQSAVSALRRFIGREGDAALLDTLREMLDREKSPSVRAQIDHALEDLDPARAANRADLKAHPLAHNLKQRLNESPDPASSPWADAHAYKQTVPRRTTEQLLEDYRAFPDPPEDETGRQNATLKREGALNEIENRIIRGETRDLRMLKDHLAGAISEDPDPFIRKHAVWDGLRAIALRGDSGLRAEIVDLFEKRLPVETHRYVRASLEAALKELKGK
jgi:hypothetical protein